MSGDGVFKMPAVNVGAMVLWLDAPDGCGETVPAIVQHCGDDSVSLVLIGRSGNIATRSGARHGDDPRRWPVESENASKIGYFRLLDSEIQRRQELEALRAEVVDLRAKLEDKER